MATKLEVHYRSLPAPQLLLAVKEVAARGPSWTAADREMAQALSSELRRRWIQPAVKGPAPAATG